MQRQGSILGSIIFAVIFMAAGWAAYKYIAKPIAEEARASEQWPSTNGVITYADIVTSKSSEGTTMYSANLSYDYTVNDKTYSGSRISMIDGSSSVGSSVEKTLKKYAKGTGVDVYYDSEIPSVAVLEPGKSIWIKFLTYLPLSFCLVGGLILLQSLKRIFKAVLY